MLTVVISTILLVATGGALLIALVPLAAGLAGLVLFSALALAARADEVVIGYKG